MRETKPKTSQSHL